MNNLPKILKQIVVGREKITLFLNGNNKYTIRTSSNFLSEREFDTLEEAIDFFNQKIDYQALHDAIESIYDCKGKLDSELYMSPREIKKLEKFKTSKELRLHNIKNLEKKILKNKKLLKEHNFYYRSTSKNKIPNGHFIGTEIKDIIFVNSQFLYNEKTDNSYLLENSDLEYKFYEKIIIEFENSLIVINDLKFIDLEISELNQLKNSQLLEIKNLDIDDRNPHYNYASGHAKFILELKTTAGMLHLRGISGLGDHDGYASPSQILYFWNGAKNVKLV